MKYLSLNILALCMTAWFFSACDPLGQYVDCDMVCEKSNLDYYMELYYHEYAHSSTRKERILFEQDSYKIPPGVRYNSGSYPAKKDLQANMTDLAVTHLVISIDSIGVYSIHKKEPEAMFYSPSYEKTLNKKSSTLYPNPYSASSWTFHLDEKQYAKRDWGVNIGKVVYTLKPLKNK